MTSDANNEVRGRTLIYFPIIHTQTDMGALKKYIRRLSLQRLGREAWQRKVALTHSMWAEIEQVVDRLCLSYDNVRLYQDGLPVCGREPEIVEQLAKAGSKNHQLLVRLMEKGATIMGTELAGSLVQEYELVKQVLEAADDQGSAEIEAERKDRGDSILKRRDQFIAGRINSTLLPNETGILFLGMLHSLENRLDGDIQVHYPINRPGGHQRGGGGVKPAAYSDRR